MAQPAAARRPRYALPCKSDNRRPEGHWELDVSPAQSKHSSPEAKAWFDVRQKPTVEGRLQDEYGQRKRQAGSPKQTAPALPPRVVSIAASALAFLHGRGSKNKDRALYQPSIRQSEAIVRNKAFQAEKTVKGGPIGGRLGSVTSAMGPPPPKFLSFNEAITIGTLVSLDVIVTIGQR
jgi:hypothetical protein